MTNAMIILQEQLRLQEEGVLKFTGNVIEVEDAAGNVVEVPEVQPIHTYKKWKSLGYVVKRGEKSFIKFPIWEYSKKKAVVKDEETDEEKIVVSGRCYMKMSAFFTEEQVERVVAK